MLASSEDDVRTLAAVLGVKFRPEAGGEIAHSAAIAVRDSDGVEALVAAVSDAAR